MLESRAAIRPRISLESDSNILNSVDCLFFFLLFVLPDALVDSLAGWSLLVALSVAAAAVDDVGMLMVVFVEATVAAGGCSEGLGGETAGIAEGTAAAAAAVAVVGAAAAAAGTTGEGSVTLVGALAVVLGLPVLAAPGATAAPKFGEVGGEVDVGRLPPSRSLSPETSAAWAAAAAVAATADADM